MAFPLSTHLFVYGKLAAKMAAIPNNELCEGLGMDSDELTILDNGLHELVETLDSRMAEVEVAIEDQEAIEADWFTSLANNKTRF